MTFNIGSDPGYTSCKASILHPSLPFVSSQILWHKSNMSPWIRTGTTKYKVSEDKKKEIGIVIGAFDKFNAGLENFKNFIKHAESFLDTHASKGTEEADAPFPVVVMPTEEEEKAGKKPSVFTLKKVKDGHAVIDTAFRSAYEAVVGSGDEGDKATGMMLLERVKAQRNSDGSFMISRERGVMVFSSGGEIVEATGKAAKLVKVISAVSKFVVIAAPVIELALAFLNPPPAVNLPLTEKQMRKIVYDETLKAYKEGGAWPHIKERCICAFDKYKGAMHYAENVGKFRIELKDSKNAGDQARYAILAYDTNENVMFAQVFLYAQTASISLLALSLLSATSQDGTESKELVDDVVQFKRELTNLHKVMRDKTTKYYQGKLNGSGLQFSNVDQFVLDYDKRSDAVVTRFHNFWDQLAQDLVPTSD